MSCQTSVPEDLRSSLKPYSESKHVIQLDQNFPPDQTGQLLLLPGFGMQGWAHRHSITDNPFAVKAGRSVVLHHDRP